MKTRSTLIYLAIAVLLAGFYFYETRHEEEKKRAEEETSALFKVKAEDVTGLVLKSGDQEMRFEKKDGTWQILHPVAGGVDPFALSRLLARLTRLKPERLMTENPKDLAEFGLHEPNVSLTFKAGDHEHSLRIGYISPIEKGYYAATGKDPKVYLIAGDDKRALDRPLFELRDKKLFTLKTDLVRQAVLERRGDRWILAKKEGKWILQGHEELNIDTEKVEAFLRPTLWAEAQSFEKEEATDLKPFGLDAPQARVLLSDDQQTEEIVYGNEATPDLIFARVQGKPQVVTVSNRLLRDLPQTKEDLVEKQKEDKKP